MRNCGKLKMEIKEEITAIAYQLLRCCSLSLSLSLLRHPIAYTLTARKPIILSPLSFYFSIRELSQVIKSFFTSSMLHSH
jgi:hypothetical protein